MATRRPDYRIAALNKETDAKGNIGVAWKNEDGSIGVVFNPFVTVPVGNNFVITMFPNEPFKEGE